MAGFLSGRGKTGRLEGEKNRANFDPHLLCFIWRIVIFLLGAFVASTRQVLVLAVGPLGTAAATSASGCLIVVVI